MVKCKKLILIISLVSASLAQTAYSAPYPQSVYTIPPHYNDGCLKYNQPCDPGFVKPRPPQPPRYAPRPQPPRYAPRPQPPRYPRSVFTIPPRYNDNCLKYNQPC